MEVNRSNCDSSYLSGINFQLFIPDLPHVSFNCQSASVPSISLATTIQTTRYNAIPQPGDEVNFDDLSIRFLVDENLKNYMTIQKWIRYLGHPESENDFKLGIGQDYEEKTYSDGYLFILDSNFKKIIKCHFLDLFPVFLGPLAFDASFTDNPPVIVDATFKYTIYNFYNIDDEKL